MIIALPARQARRATPTALQIHGSTRLEIIWTVVPVLILAAIACFVFVKLPSIADAPTASAADSTTITVEGHQFYWMFRYPNGAVSIGTMIAPADNVVQRGRLRARQRRAPQLVGAGARRQDRRDPRAATNHTWFKAPAGEYPARCSDLCGIQHTLMTGDGERRAARPSTSRSSRSAPRTPTSIELGKEEWDHVCAVCHKLDEAYVGPSLGANPIAHEREGPDRRSSANGVGKMPAVGSDWSDDQIDALVKYTKTIVKPPSASGG